MFLEKRKGWNEKHPGIKGRDGTLQKLLDQENYIEVLKHIWSEKDVEVKQAWLRKAATKFHVLAMFELGDLLCEQGSIIEGNVWLRVAAICTQADQLCYNDSSIANGDASLAIFACYGKHMQKTGIHHGKTIQQLARVCAQYQQSVQNLPSPRWLEGHGLNTMLKALGISISKEPPLKPQNTWADIRKASIANALKSPEQPKNK